MFSVDELKSLDQIIADAIRVLADEADADPEECRPALESLADDVERLVRNKDGK